ncbi:MAG: MlaE family ABC transporter permease [Candidatus Babeliales bacterium]
MILQVIDYVGALTLGYCNTLGTFVLFLYTALYTLLTTKLKLKKVFAQMEHVGVNSLAIVMLTGLFTGAVLAFQSYIGFKRFGAEGFIGPVVALSLTRELGPVLTGLMVTGRAGSAMTAEIGTMRITEQIDALETLRLNVFQYLITPRLIASTIILPFLALFTMLLGIIGGYIISTQVLGLNGVQFIKGIQRYVELSDVTNGLIKSAAFGLILSWVGSYKGYYAHGGARGVGISTTQSVVISSIMILIANYFLTAILF